MNNKAIMDSIDKMTIYQHIVYELHDCILRALERTDHPEDTVMAAQSMARDYYAEKRFSPELGTAFEHYCNEYLADGNNVRLYNLLRVIALELAISDPKADDILRYGAL